MTEILSKVQKGSSYDYKLKKLIRYNHRNRLTDENVAEHTCFVSIFAIKLIDLYSEEFRFFKNDIATQCNILRYAILHDLPELHTSDIPYDVKRDWPEIKITLEQIEKKFINERFPIDNNLFYGESYQLERSIVKFADLLSVLQFVNNEIELGNKSSEMNDILIQVEELIYKQDELCYNKLKNIYIIK